jgi:serine/threonine protein phosphatase 1
MNGVKYEFYQNYFIGIELETALALDRNIKPNDLLYPKRLTLYDEVYMGHTPVTRIGWNLYKWLCLEFGYRSGF